MILAEYIFGNESIMVMMLLMLIQMHIMAGFCYRM